MRNFTNCTILILLLLAVLTVDAFGRVFFVAPDGKASNSGDISSPWDLQTALSHPSVVKPGDIIYLRGGVYIGTFVSKLVGAPENPITVRSFPSEWAIIDGNQPLKLLNSIGSGREAITLSGPFNLPASVIIMVNNERLELINRVGNTYTVNRRGMDGTVATPHAAGSMARAATEILTINGSDVIFGNFEVTDSRMERNIPVSGSNAININSRFTGINLFAPRSKVINTVVHNTLSGIGFWVSATDSELYGNILYNNGMRGLDRGHGHGIYTQNNLGQKTIDDNILFGNFGGFGLHSYGSSNAYLQGFSFSGNVNFLNRWLIGGSAPADNIKIFNNFLYGDGMELGYLNQNNGSLIIQNNYVYSANPLVMKWWKQVLLTGNRFYNDGRSGAIISTTIASDKAILSNYNIENNNYISALRPQDKPFHLVGSILEPLNLDEWRNLGFDRNSILQQSTVSNPQPKKPMGVDIFYRPNKYERGRANIVVYNFDGVSTFSVDLSKTGLVQGQRFEIRNGQNFTAPPILTGIYQGQSATVNITGLSIAQPTGNTTIRNMETCPQFCVFVVVPIDTPLAPPTSSVTQPTPIATPTPVPPQPAPNAGNAEVSFTGFDANTKGNWRGVYGTQGFTVIGEPINLPAWAQMSVNGNNEYTWAGSTSDSRALAKISNSNDRIAKTFYTPATYQSGSQFEMNFNFTDGQAHKLSLYSLDWEGNQRQQVYEIIDPVTGSVLDTRTISNFNGGVYSTWNVKGRITVRVKNSSPNSINAVVSGVFVDPITSNSTQTPAPAPTTSPDTSNDTAAAFVAFEGNTKGNWTGAYGNQGNLVVGEATNLPSWAQFSVFGHETYTWAGSTADPRALVKTANSNNRIASTLYSPGAYSPGQFEMKVNFTDGQSHRLALYSLDWEGSQRQQTFELINTATGAVLDTRMISNFNGGVYSIWQVKGAVTVRVKNAGGQSVNAVVSGVFIDSPTTTLPNPSVSPALQTNSNNTASFVREDSSTRGNWTGAYGNQGYIVVGESPRLPEWAKLSAAGQQSYTWTGSTEDGRALIKAPNNSDRIAATWYTPTQFEMNFNFTDGQLHRLSLYAVDWDNYNNRQMEFEVIDSDTGVVLDRRTVADFVGGKYLVWQVKGRVTVRVKNIGGPNTNAVVSGIFIDAP